MFGWKNLRLVSNHHILRISWASVLTVPLVANFSATTSQQCNFLSAFLLILDPVALHIPVNMARYFFVSIFISLSGLLYSVFCPAPLAYTDAKEWLKSSSADRYRAELRRKSPKKTEVQITYDADHYFTSYSYSFLSPPSIPLIICWLLVAASLWLVCLIVYDNFERIISLVGPLQLFLPHLKSR